MEREFATDIYAKVNLTLDVGAKNALGYHAIDSIMYPFPLFDRIRVAARNDGEVNVRYTDGRVYASDNALRAARYLTEKYHTYGMDVEITKGIPEGVGLGGSSADAAGIARCFEKLYDIKLDSSTLLKLGSDVPFQYLGKCARVSSSGESVEEMDLPKLYITLVYGEGKLSASEVYAAYDLTGGAGGDANAFMADLKPYNALETAAVNILPDIVRARHALTLSGFDKVTMTGSGVGYIGITDNEELNDVLYGRARKLAEDNNLKIYNSKSK